MLALASAALGCSVPGVDFYQDGGRDDAGPSEGGLDDAKVSLETGAYCGLTGMNPPPFGGQCCTGGPACYGHPCNPMQCSQCGGQCIWPMVCCVSQGNAACSSLPCP